MYDSHILKKNLTAKPLRVKLSHYLKAKKQFIMHHVVLFIFGYTIVVVRGRGLVVIPRVAFTY